jgi:hypothetical protein
MSQQPVSIHQIQAQFGTDSANYEVLTDAAIRSKGVEGAAVEIGVRLGGGLQKIIDGLVESGQTPEKPVFGIDPYGNIEYYRDEIFKEGRCDYTNEMRDICMINLYLYCRQKNVNFYMFNLEDTEFFNRYADGVPIYAEHKSILNKYSVVHFDGPHTLGALDTEIAFFLERSDPGTVFVFDDVEMYEHAAVHNQLLEHGMETAMETPRKWSYVKKEHVDKKWEPMVGTPGWEPNATQYTPKSGPIFNYKIDL